MLGFANIGLFCTEEVVYCRRETTIVEAAKLMREYHVGALAVVSEVAGEKRPVGIVTDRDLVMEVLAQEVPVDSVLVADVMTAEPLCVHHNMDVAEAIDRMRVEGVKRVLVVNESGTLVGIAALDDLLRFFAAEFAELVELVDIGHDREKTRRPTRVPAVEERREDAV